MASKKYNIYDLRIMRQQWHEVPVEVIPENSLDLYKKRKEAVDM